MKKLLLSAFALATVIGTTNAQTYFSDDFTGGIGNWTATDVDGDGKNWEASSEANWNNNAALAGLGEFAMSRSWTQADGGLNPNNFLVTTQPIDLTGVTPGTNITLSWDMGTIEGTPYEAETYSVYVTASNLPATIATATPVLTGTLSNPQQVDPYSVNLDAFAGQSVYLTFRHHNTFDMNMILVDNVLMKTTDNIDATLTSINIPAYATAGPLTISGVITNNGLNPITAMDITWNDGSGPQTDNLTGLNIASGATYNFNHSVPLNVVANNSYNVTVDVALTGDANMADNSLSANVAGLTQVPAKVVVGEEKTGTWCGWCPRGAVGLAGMEATPEFIGIAVHNADPMVISNYDSGTATYHPDFTGYPHGAVDRVIGGDPGSFSTMHSQRVNELVPCDVKNIVAEFNSSTNTVSVSADAEFYGNVSGNYRMSCVILQDDMIATGSGWSQINYYSFQSQNLPLTDPVSGFDWQAASTPTAASAFGGYDHVARSLSGNDILGNAGSLPAGTVPAGVHPYTFAPVATSSMSGSAVAYDYTKSHAVVMVVDAATGEILNAGSAPVSLVTAVNEVENTHSMTVFPNPTVDVAVVNFYLKANTTVKMEVYNTLGELVQSTDATNYAAGANKIEFDGSDLNKGLYFVNLTIGDEVVTRKVTLK